jgi:DNA repair protein RadC
MAKTRQREIHENWVSYWPSGERPRERLLQQGPKALSDAELLAIFLRVGVRGKNVVELARQLIQHFGGLRGLFKASASELQSIKGMGAAKVATLRAIAEINQRWLEEKISRTEFLECAQDVYRLLEQRLRDRGHEIFAIVFLDTKHRVLTIEELFHGTIDSASVFPREIVKRALELGAAALIAVHNHPSGIPEPSLEDQKITRELKAACQLMELRLLDHVVIGANSYHSFAEHHQLAS